MFKIKIITTLQLVFTYLQTFNFPLFLTISTYIVRNNKLLTKHDFNFFQLSWQSV